MKRFLFGFGLLVLVMYPLAAQQPGIDQDSELLVLPAGEKFLTWYGHAGRTYFLQVSSDSSPLGKWHWAPVIESGTDQEISYEVGGTASKGFFRLRYTDQSPAPGFTLESADYDSDGISNLDEINPPAPLTASDATDPLNPDTDGDGLLDGWERSNGLDANDPGTGNPLNGAEGDPDFDGVANFAEQTFGSDPKNSDSDLDGASDGDEAASGHDLASNQSHPPIWIHTRRHSFHGLPYIQSSMEWNLAGTVHHDGFPSASAPGTCAALLAADCPFPLEPLAPVYNPFNGYSVGLSGSTGHRPDPGPSTTLSHTRFWRKTLPAPVAATTIKLLKVTRRVVHGSGYTEVMLPTEFEIVDVTIPAGSSISNPVDALPVFTQVLGDGESESVEVELVLVDITVAFGLGPEPFGDQTSKELLEEYLESVKVARDGNTWFVQHENALGNPSIRGIEIVTAKEGLIHALKQNGQTVVFDGHSNFGLGPNFTGKQTHKTLSGFTRFGVGMTSIPMSYRGDGTENDIVQFTNGDGTPEPNDPQDLAAIGRVYSEGWAYLILQAGQVFASPKNYLVPHLNVQRFPNLQGVAPDSVFVKQGVGFNNEWHFDMLHGPSRRLIVESSSSDLPGLRYSRFFYNACNTGRDYIENFQRGTFFYTKDSCRVESASRIFVQGVVEGKTNAEIMVDLNQNGVGNVENQNPNIYEYKSF